MLYSEEYSIVDTDRSNGTDEFKSTGGIFAICLVIMQNMQKISTSEFSTLLIQLGSNGFSVVYISRHAGGTGMEASVRNRAASTVMDTVAT